MAPIASKGESGTARVLGSATAGISELFLFHPVDTITKRLMNNQTKIFTSGQPLSQGISTFNKVIFRDAAEKGYFRRFTSLFPGLGYAAGYKILQRVYKFGGQPVVKDYLNKHYGSDFTRVFGKRNGNAIMFATAGSLIGIGEVVLLPLDVLKIKRQTNPEAFKGRGVFKIISEERLNLYKGTGWTMARNAPGSFALFGGSAIVKDYVFGLRDYNKATYFQNFCASIGGAVASLTVSAPLDVIKTRIQAKNFEVKTSGFTIFKDLIKTEGWGGLFKGLTPKILVVGPKLIFSFTIAQILIPEFDRMLSKKAAL
ncbi:putative mitochondrial carrier [Zancudomyces culisetae]|uniref:Putative mitochondrial carrier n=1 Tax=Zancudomyces culisetae TaxID=1213189 RepID=A0A1R1PBY5_ZANCU|nr:putative mitochondrial carrier [Zancudomyces culisetae]|eukprot:OMH78439.1 putative mitochondrial carrier [Zancudomyces culisetae]